VAQRGYEFGAAVYRSILAAALVGSMFDEQAHH